MAVRWAAQNQIASDSLVRCRRVPAATAAAGGTPEAVCPLDGDEPPGAGVVGEPALEGDEAGGDFGHGTVPRQECHANIPSSDIPGTMPCVAGAMCIINLMHFFSALIYLIISSH